MSPDFGISKLNNSILEQEDCNLIGEINSKLKENNGLTPFLQVIDLVFDHLKHPDFLKDDILHLSNPDIVNVFGNIEYAENLMRLQSCRRADAIVSIIFANKKFKKYWDQINASKIQAAIAGFCQKIHSYDFSGSINLVDYIYETELLLKEALREVKDYPLLHGSEGLLVDNNLMDKLALLMIVRANRVICLDPEVRADVFKVKGTGTYATELCRAAIHGDEFDFNILEFIDSQFEDEGMFHEMMRVNLEDSTKHFSNRGITVYDRTYIENMKIIMLNDLGRGRCPASLSLVGDNENISLANKVSQIIMSAIPQHLRSDSSSLSEFEGGTDF